jgi:fermentation-respiration switch protein FrsA (DUF1100 family)
MLRILLPIVVAYCVVLLLARVFENHFIFFPNYPGRLTGEWAPRRVAPEDVWLEASDGVKVHAWWIPAEEARYTFVLFHGNASNIAGRLGIYEYLRSLPVNVLAVEYRGYGKSEGAPSEAGFYRDAEAAYSYLTRSRGIVPERIVAMGQSLGTAVAAHLAAQEPVGGVVLIAPFPSAAAVARRMYWFLPGLGYVLRTRFDTGAQLQRIRVPVLMVHCTKDPVLPYAMGEAVYGMARPPKRFVAVDGVCHEEAAFVAPVEVREAIESLLACIDKGPPCPEFVGGTAGPAPASPSGMR